MHSSGGGVDDPPQENSIVTLRCYETSARRDLRFGLLRLEFGDALCCPAVSNKLASRFHFLVIHPVAPFPFAAQFLGDAPCYPQGWIQAYPILGMSPPQYSRHINEVYDLRINWHCHFLGPKSTDRKPF